MVATRSRLLIRALALVAVLMISAPVSAEMLQISVNSGQPSGGFAFSPVWVGVHDGTFTTFTPGTTAGAGIQNVAELADASVLSSDFAGHGSQTVVGGAPIGPGGSASGLLNVTTPSMDRYLSFASMVVPSNDFFFGNANPTAFALFDAAGHFNGPLTIQIFGSNVWDAGTEVNDINFGAAFIVGDNIADHTAEGGVVGLVFGGPADNTAYLNSILGQPTPYGYDISHLISPNDLIATIQISAVPEPSSLVLCGFGIAGLAAFGWRKRAGRLKASERVA
jgi:hypothetical protein